MDSTDETLKKYWQNYIAGDVEILFGSCGKSGYGREKGRETLWNSVQTKNIAVAVGASRGD